MMAVVGRILALVGRPGIEPDLGLKNDWPMPNVMAVAKCNGPRGKGGDSWVQG